MRIDTTRFGTLDIHEREMFLFPQGLIGMETLRQWVLMPDPQSPAVAWLQSASRSDAALALVSPRAFVEDYRVRAHRRALSSLHLRPGARQWYLDWIAGEHPELLEGYRTLYARGSYAAPSYRKALGRRTTAAARRHGLDRSGAHRITAADGDGPPRATAPGAPGQSPQQSPQPALF